MEQREAGRFIERKMAEEMGENCGNWGVGRRWAHGADREGDDLMHGHQTTPWLPNVPQPASSPPPHPFIFPHVLSDGFNESVHRKTSRFWEKIQGELYGQVFNKAGIKRHLNQRCI